MLKLKRTGSAVFSSNISALLFWLEADFAEPFKFVFSGSFWQLRGPGVLLL